MEELVKICRNKGHEYFSTLSIGGEAEMSKDNFLDLKVLREFGKFLHGNWEKEIVLIELLQLFEEVVQCKQASAYLFEHGNYQLKAKIGDPIPFDLPCVVDEHRKLVACKNFHDNYCEPVKIGEKSLYLMPLICSDKVLGLILYRLPRQTRRQSEIISIFATQVSVALRYSHVEEEKKQIDDLVYSFTAGPDIHVFYPIFAKRLREITDFDRLTITLPNPFNDNELIVYAEDSKKPFLVQRMQFEGSAPAWVMSTGKPLMEADLALNRNFPEDKFLLSTGIRCALRLPLISKGRVIGTLNPGNEKPNVYNQEQINLFAEIAKKVGPAIENALIYETINDKLSQTLIQLENSFSATLNALAVLLDTRDAGTKGHSLRVVRYATAVAEILGLKGKELEDIRLGSLLHDIGKIGIPDSILFKPGKLSDDEWTIMRTHPELGAEMVAKMDFLSPAKPIVLHHHEWYNGNGYPGKLAGEKIPLGARIFAIADAFDAMTSDRPYRKRLPIEQAMQAFIECKGTQFCPMCSEAFLKMPSEQLHSIYDECQSEVAFQSPYLIGQDFVNVEMAKNLVRRKN